MRQTGAELFQGRSQRAAASLPPPVDGANYSPCGVIEDTRDQWISCEESNSGAM